MGPRTRLVLGMVWFFVRVAAAVVAPAFAFALVCVLLWKGL